MKLTDFTFYKNTPFTDFQNTILFNSNKERDDYFNSHFDTISFENMRFNFIRDRGTIRISTSYLNIAGVNYCKFNSDFEKDFIYYAYVMDYQYINDNTTELTLLIDGIMTFCQGDTLSKFNNLSVTRKHLRKSEYNKRLTELKNNDDRSEEHTSELQSRFYLVCRLLLEILNVYIIILHNTPIPTIFPYTTLFRSDYQYINDNTTELTLLIDGIMTFCQGDTLSKFNNLSVTRKHLRKSEYNKRLTELKNNDDVIKTYTKSYTDTEKLLFDELDVLMQVSCSLTADFGKVDDPKIETSEG